MSDRNIIGVQFEPVGKNYYFDASRFPDLKPGDPVVVRTSRGLQLATTTQTHLDVDDLAFNSFKTVERPADPSDLLQRKALAIREAELAEQIRTYLIENGLAPVKVVSVEYALDGNRVYVALNNEPSVHYNLKRVQQDIQALAGGVQLELRQIGPRDAAKLIGGMGACGLEKRCCAQFLTEFSSISIRMAKTQDISLTPSEITGMCGRLRCCLMYEYDLYVEAIKSLPKRKKKVLTPMGEGRVIQVLPLRQAVIVNLPEVGPRQFSKEDLDRAARSARGESVEPLPEDVAHSNDSEQPQTDQRTGPSKPRRGRKSGRSNDRK